jgi:DNA-binding NarL/FixJ family response regulator
MERRKPMNDGGRLRVLLADDQLLFVESLKCVLEERARDFDLVGVAHDGEEAVRLAMELQPDVVLMDVRMPRLDGVQATRRLHELYPRMKIVMLTTFDDDDYIEVALKFGAIGYLLKNIPPEDLIRAVRAVHGGVTQMAPEVVEKLLSRQRAGAGAPPEAPAVLETLTRREKEILVLVREACDNRQIAARLGVSEQTVKNHMHSLYEKLGVPNRLQLIKVLGRKDA